MKPVSDTNREPGLPVIKAELNLILQCGTTTRTNIGLKHYIAYVY